MDMETTSAAPAADVSSSAPSGDSGVSLDSLFDSPSQDTASEAPVAAEPAAPAATTEIADEQPEPAAENPDEDAEPPLDPSGKAVTIKKGRWDNVYQGHKFARQVQEFAPTVEAARAHYEAATDMRQIVADLQSAQPQNIDNIIGYLAQQSPQGVGVLAERGLEHLKNTAPQAYEGIQSRILSEIVDSNYAAAAQSGDPMDLYKAQQFEWTQTGKYRQAGEIKAPDPLAAREAKITQAEQELQQRQQREQQAVVEGWKNDTYSHIRTNIDAETDKILGPAKESFAPEVLSMLKNEIRRQVIASVAEDKEFGTNYNIDFQKATQARTEEARNQLSDRYLSRVRPIIKAVAKPLITKATQVAVAANQATHNRAQQSQAKTATGGGRPVPHSATPAVRPGMSLDQHLDAVFAS